MGRKNNILLFHHECNGWVCVELVSLINKQYTTDCNELTLTMRQK